VIIHRAEKAFGGTICEDCAIKDAKKSKSNERRVLGLGLEVEREPTSV
jgi:hypothetical protein